MASDELLHRQGILAELGAETIAQLIPGFRRTGRTGIPSM